MLNGTVATLEQNSPLSMIQQSSTDCAGSRTISQQQQILPNDLTEGSRLQQQQQRRQSISLNAVINHRRALLGALLTRVGSNISLPTCLPQEQETLTSQSYIDATPPGNTNTYQKPILLQLTPVATATEPLTNLDEQTGDKPLFDVKKTNRMNKKSQKQQYSELMSSISTLYANLLVVVGVAVPVTASVSQQAPKALDQGFYLYLYMASVTFVVAMYGTLARDKALKKMIVKHVELQEKSYIFGESGISLQSIQPKSKNDYTTSGNCHRVHHCKNIIHNQQQQQHEHYGSFCLRLGTVGFGAGSLVFTGLYIGAELASEPLRAIVPGTRLLLVTAQMHFIFLNSKDLVFTKHEALAKLGLMHLIATNICEWLKALVEETSCEIIELERARTNVAHNNSNTTISMLIENKNSAGIHRKLLRDASPFLFPCTIEFSLICAVILYEMWRRIDERRRYKDTTNNKGNFIVKGNGSSSVSGIGIDHYHRDVITIAQKSTHQLSIDCGSAHRGLFGGILVVAATVLSLIMFFVLKEARPQMAVQQVTSLEVAIQISGTLATIFGGFKLLSQLEHVSSSKPPHLDATLLAAAQAGVYLHTMFGAVGSILTQGSDWLVCLAADILALLQSTLQTVLIKIAWRRRSRSNEKPGKELITFLIVVNIAMWTINTLEKSRAGVRPDHLELFGVWAWTIITHVSMPLAIFYRFHSAICLFEVWKSCYKYRPIGVGKSTTVTSV